MESQHLHHIIIFPLHVAFIFLLLILEMIWFLLDGKILWFSNIEFDERFKQEISRKINLPSNQTGTKTKKKKKKEKKILFDHWFPTGWTSQDETVIKCSRLKNKISTLFLFDLILKTNIFNPIFVISEKKKQNLFFVNILWLFTRNH